MLQLGISLIAEVKGRRISTPARLPLAAATCIGFSPSYNMTITILCLKEVFFYTTFSFLDGNKQTKSPQEQTKNTTIITAENYTQLLTDVKVKNTK